MGRGGIIVDSVMGGRLFAILDCLLAIMIDCGKAVWAGEVGEKASCVDGEAGSEYIQPLWSRSCPSKSCQVP